MFKVCILLAVAVACVAAQESAVENAAAPEPYSYAYQTDTHAASEQRDPQGKVTGFYTLVDADGRERRVEYIADEGGFRAKVATNEVGTRASNPADVEILASDPTPAQFAVYQQSPQIQTTVQAQAPVVRQQQYVQQRVATTVAAAPQPQLVRSQVQYTQQQASYPQYAYGATGYNTGAYYPGYAYGGYGNQGAYGYGNQGIGYGYGNQGVAYGYGNQGAIGYGRGFQVGNYNNHLPSEYYRSISTSGTTVGNAAAGGVQGVRYISQPAGGVTTTTTSGYRTLGYQGAVNYGNPNVASVGGVVPRSSNLQGSSNYLVIQKRAATDEKKSS